MMKDAFEVINSMSALTRYSQAHNITRESVLEHTAFVAIFGAAICHRIGADPTKVLRRAIVHDIDEIVTGDIPTPTKYANDIVSEALQELEAKGANESICKLFTESESFYDDWACAKDDSIDGWVIKVSDSAAVIYKMWQEAMLGNKTLLEYRPRLRSVFEGWLHGNSEHVERLADVITELLELLENIE